MTLSVTKYRLHYYVPYIINYICNGWLVLGSRQKGVCVSKKVHSGPVIVTNVLNQMA